MFLCRNEELDLINGLYKSKKFEFLVLYGRRRVGKTSILKEFSKTHNVIFFSAQEKNDTLNLQDFSITVQKHFDGHVYSSFSGWKEAFEYISLRADKDEKTTLIIDEFPFIAKENPSVKSILQHTIDHIWKELNIFLILCGSSVSFMENEVMGYKSPLYGRSTSQLEVLPFDYLDSSEFFPEYSSENKLAAYGILGGIPCYLQTFTQDKTIAENISLNILRTGSFLKEEPQALLKMELRDPAIYNSVFEAIANGASRINDIALKIKEDSSKCSKYIKTLTDLKLISKASPCGEDNSSKKSLYSISDNFFSFWYRYLFTDRNYFELTGPDNAANEIMEPESFNDYMGIIFEKICQQYMIRLAKAGKLPFIPRQIGKWWGTNSLLKRQDDCDILLISRDGKKAAFCECKYKNSPFDKKELDDLKSTAEFFDKIPEKHFYLFSKSGFTDYVIKQTEIENNITLVNPDMLFSI